MRDFRKQNLLTEPFPLSTVKYLFCVVSGSEMVEAQCQRFEVRSTDGERVLFSADEEEISIGTEKLKVTGRIMHKKTLCIFCVSLDT